MATVSMFLPNLSGITGLVMHLKKSSDYSAVNGVGDAMSESGTSGWFTATVAETWAETVSVTVVDSDGLVPASGWLGVGDTIVSDVKTIQAAVTEVTVVDVTGDALTYFNAKFASTLGHVVVSIAETEVTGFPVSLRKGDARTVANGKSIAVRIYADDDTEFTTPLLGTGDLLFADAEVVEFGLTLPLEEEPEVSFEITWEEDGADGYFLIVYDENELTIATAFVSGKLTYHQWGIKVTWPTIPQPVTVAEGTVKILNPIL